MAAVGRAWAAPPPETELTPIVNLIHRVHHLIMRLQWQETRQTPDRKVEATPTIATPSRDVIIRLADLSVAKTNIA